MIKSPMLADNKPWNPKLVKANLPVFGSIKLDGVRALIHNGVAYSRSLKPLPNKCLQDKVQKHSKLLEGFDGEIIVGSLTDEFCFKKSNRACMKINLEADHRFYVFDIWNLSEWEYRYRLASIRARINNCYTFDNADWVHELIHVRLESMEEVNDFAQRCLDNGHEGAIFQSTTGLYKHGRASTKSGLMYKFKSRIDTEVIVTDFHELMINNNEKKTNELGRSSRSSHQENLVPGDTLGAISCSGSFEDGTPFTCKVGVFSGFTKEDLRAIWNHKERFLGQLMKIKYMGIGSDKAPRTPVALGFRNPIDL